MTNAAGGAGSARADEHARRLRRLLIVGFFAALLPLLPGELRYHGDERFYSDGAMHMLRSGEYLTPVYADGTPRLLKPGLSYWFIAASYKLLGVGLASSRLPSLLAAAGVLWLAGRTVLALGGSESASFLAVAILASNMSLLLAAVRSTPDALLCLFLSMSLFGFLRLIARDERGTGVFALAYPGAGLAVAAKGLLGLLPVAFAFAYCGLARGRDAPSPRTLVHWPSMLAGTAIALFWFIAILVQHGTAAWTGFFADQVTAKVDASWLHAVTNVPRYLLAALQHFLPWSALALVAWREGQRETRQEDRQRALVRLYALGVFAIMVAIFSAGRDMRPRYLLPAYPLIAVAFSPWLAHRFSVQGGAALVRWLKIPVVVVGIGGGLAVAALGWALDRRIAVAGFVLAAASVLAVVAGRRGWHQAATGTALLLILALPLHDRFVSPVFNTQPARAVAARIATLDPPPARVGLLGLGGEFAGLLSLHLKGSVAVATLGTFPAIAAVTSPAVLVATEKHRGDLAARGYRLEPCGFLQRRWTARDLWQALRRGGAASYLGETRIPVYLAIAARPST